MRGVWGITLASGLGFAIPQYLTAKYLGPQLPALFGSLGSLAITAFWAHRANGGQRLPFSAKYMWEAWRPYVIILILILGAGPLCPPVNKALSSIQSGFVFVHGGKTVYFKWLATPGVLIVVATFIAGFLARLRMAQIGRLLKIGDRFASSHLS